MPEHDSAKISEQAKLLYATISRLQRRIIMKHVPPRGTQGTVPDLTMPQSTMMLVIRERGPLSLKDLAGALGVSAPSASTMVERLVEAGVFERKHSDQDRREVRVSLTTQGLAAASSLEGHLLTSLVDMLERLGPETSEKWCEVYGQIRDVLDEALKLESDEVSAVPSGRAAK